jgi:hypothetical protein
MGVSEWTTFLSEDLRLDVHIEYRSGQPVKFAFQLTGLIEGEWVELVRYDDAHGEPHRHIFYPDGTVEPMSFTAVLPVTFVGWVQRDITDHAEQYAAEYRRQYMNMLTSQSE